MSTEFVFHEVALHLPVTVKVACCLGGARTVDDVPAGLHDEGEAAGEARGEVLLLAQNVGEVARPQLGFGDRTGVLVLHVELDLAGGHWAGLGAQPWGVRVMFTVGCLASAPAGGRPATPASPTTPAMATSDGQAGPRGPQVPARASRDRTVSRPCWCRHRDAPCSC